MLKGKLTEEVNATQSVQTQVHLTVIVLLYPLRIGRASQCVGCKCYPLVGIISISAALTVQVNLETMEMYSPLKGKLRRTHYEGLYLNFTMTENDYAVQAKVGHLQVAEGCVGTGVAMALALCVV